jgi:hypothetical protein
MRKPSREKEKHLRAQAARFTLDFMVRLLVKSGGYRRGASMAV